MFIPFTPLCCIIIALATLTRRQWPPKVYGVTMLVCSGLIIADYIF